MFFLLLLILVAGSLFGLKNRYEGVGPLGWIMSKVEVDMTDKTGVQTGVVVGTTEEVGLHRQWLYQSKWMDRGSDRVRSGWDT